MLGARAPAPAEDSQVGDIDYIKDTPHPKRGGHFLPLKFQTHLIGQGVEQQHRLTPGGIDLIPFHGNTGQATQSEVIDGAKLSTVPGGRREGGGKHRETLTLSNLRLPART